MPEKQPNINPEEVEEWAKRIRAKKGPRISFPESKGAAPESEAAEMLPLEIPEEESEKLEPAKKIKSKKEYRYAEGDPVIFNQAKQDKAFRQFLERFRESRRINFEKPTPKDMAEIVRLYEDFKDIQSS